MNELMIRWESRWNQLGIRERRLLMGGALVLGLLLFVLLIIKPANDYLNNARSEWIGAYQDLRWIEQQQAVLRESGASTVEGANQSILTIANLTASEFGLTWNRSEPGEQGLLRLWLEDVSFDKLVAWISQIQERFGISVHAIQVEKGSDDGLVDVRLEIIR